MRGPEEEGSDPTLLKHRCPHSIIFMGLEPGFSAVYVK